MLRQLNKTNIVLIPKIDTPKLVNTDLLAFATLHTKLSVRS